MPKAVSGTLFCLLVCLQHTSRHCHVAPSSTQHICTCTATEVLTGSQGVGSVSVSQIKQIDHRSRELPFPAACQGKRLDLSPTLFSTSVSDCIPQGPHVLLTQPLACTSSFKTTTALLVYSPAQPCVSPLLEHFLHLPGVPPFWKDVFSQSTLHIQIG